MAKGKISKFFAFLQKIIFAVIKSVFRGISFFVKKFNEADISPDVKKRVVSGFILIVVSIYAIVYSQAMFSFLAVAAVFILTVEWINMTGGTKNQKKWHLIGFLAIVIPIYSAIQIRQYDVQILFWMFAVIWATDIFAFFAGRYFGGIKLAPTISPNKTWSGLLGGIAASMVIGFISSFMFTSGNIRFFILLSAFLAILGQVGDLLESKVKRIFGVKDSGKLIPGHGGLMDRLDGLVLVAPTVLFFVITSKEKFLPALSVALSN